MRIVSVNVGRPRTVPWEGKLVTTGIFKQPVEGRVAVRGRSIEGDRQADRRVHGGPFKAVYAYPSEHYAFWRRRHPRLDLGWGAFGENLTVEGWTEESVHVGDRYRAGDTVLVVTQPRTPCYKLGIRMGRPEIVEEFVAALRPGFYLGIVDEGEVAAGDAFERISTDPRRVTVTDMARLAAGEDLPAEILRQALQLEHLPEGWKAKVRKALAARPTEAVGSGAATGSDREIDAAG